MMAGQRLHFSADTQGLWLFVDADWQTLAAVPPNAALGAGWLAQICTDDRERVAAAWQKAVRDGLRPTVDHRDPIQFSYTLLSGVRINHHASPMSQGFVGSLEVVTEAASEAPSPAESNPTRKPYFLQHLCDGLPAMVCQYQVAPDGSDRFTYLSQSCESIFELSPDICIADAQRVWDLVHPEDLAWFTESIQVATQTLAPWVADRRLLMPDGRIKWINTRALLSPDPAGGVIWNGILLDITEQKQAELAFQGSELRLRTLMANIPGAIFRYLLRADQTDAMLYISAGCEDIWELSDEAALADVRQLWEMVHPEDIEAMYASVLESAANLTPWHWGWRMTTPSGRKKWLEASGQPQRHSNGDTVWDTVILDVTERKQAELALQAAEQHFKTLAENSPDIIERFDRDLRHLYVSPALERLTGFSTAASLGKTCHELEMDPGMVTAFEAAATQALKTAEPQRIEFETPTQIGHCTFEMVIVPELAFNPATDQSEVVSLLCISRNVTRYREALQAYQASEARLATLIDNLPGFVYTFLHTPDYPATYLSEGVEAITGYSLEHFISQALYFGQIMHSDDREFVWQAINTATAAHIPYEFEYRIITATGQERWVWERGQGIFDGRDQLLYIEGFVTDITERKQAELELEAKIQREQALNRVTQAIRDSLDLTTIFATATRDVAELFQLHSATVIHYEPESAEWRHVYDHYRDPTAEHFPNYVIPDHDNPFAARLKRGEIVNASTDRLTDPVNQAIAQTFPGTWLLLPLLVEGQTWGSLSLYITDSDYIWSADQVDLAQLLANQLAIAIQQAQLTEQLQSANQHLQQQVAVRTQALQKALEFEALTRRITNQISVSFNETEILTTVVEAIGQSLQPLLCNVSTYDDMQPQIRHTYRHGLCRGGNLVLPVEQHLDIYGNLYGGHITQATTHIASLNKRATLLVVPIRQEDHTIGDILIMRAAEEQFSLAEIDLVRQVSDQCTIALRQSRLYQAAQNQVEELQRLNQLKDDFLSTISHELRTPMTSIKMATQMLNLHLGNLSDLPEFIWRYIDVLKSESDREIALINDLLEMTRLEAGAADLSLSPIDLAQLIHRLSAPLSLRMQAQQQTFVVAIPADLPIIYSDAHYLERIIGELLFNACKYTPAHEQIQVSASLGELTSRLAIAITNTGISIPEDQWECIFEKFYRLTHNDPWKHGGTGLGLALVQQCAATLGGRISVNSTATSTTFTVELPAILTAATGAKR